MARAGTVAVLPRLGTADGLVDMDYAERDSRESGTAIDPRVWLTADAPPGLTDRLHEAGLTIVDSQSDVDRVGYLSHQGPGAPGWPRVTTFRYSLTARGLSRHPPGPSWPQPLLAWAFCGVVLVVGAAMAAATDGSGRSRDSVPAATGLTSSEHGGNA